MCQVTSALSNSIAHQTPLSKGFSRQEYWSGLPCPPPGDLPDPGIETASPASPALQADSLPRVTWEPVPEIVNTELNSILVNELKSITDFRVKGSGLNPNLSIISHVTLTSLFNLSCRRRLISLSALQGHYNKRRQERKMVSILSSTV